MSRATQSMTLLAITKHPKFAQFYKLNIRNRFLCVENFTWSSHLPSSSIVFLVKYDLDKSLATSSMCIMYTCVSVFSVYL